MVKFRTKRNSIENKFSISSLGIPHGIPFLFLLRPHFRGSPPYYFLFHFIYQPLSSLTGSLQYLRIEDRKRFAVSVWDRTDHRDLQAGNLHMILHLSDMIIHIFEEFFIGGFLIPVWPVKDGIEQFSIVRVPYTVYNCAHILLDTASRCVKMFRYVKI